MTVMANLFPKLPFIADETPMSWASRQAAFHMGGGVAQFLNDLRIPVLDLARGQRSAVERLCQIAGQDPDVVHANNIEALGTRRYELRGHPFAAEFTTGVVTRFCPLCVQEDCVGGGDPRALMRHRLQWRLSTVRTCNVHHLPLSNVRRGKWDDTIHELQAMRDLFLVESSRAKFLAVRQPSPLQTYVEKRLVGASGPGWLDVQDIDQVCRATEMLGGLVAFGPAQKAADMDQDMWDAAGRAGWSLVVAGPKQIQNILADQLKSCMRMNGHPSPRNAFGMLYGWLFASRQSKDPGPIRDIVREVIIENVPLVPGQMLLGEVVERPRLASIASIAKSEGLHPKTLSNVLRVSGVISDTIPVRGARNVVADYEKARALIDATKHAVPAIQVPDMLTASRPLVAALLELGHLTRIQDHEAVKSKLGKSVDGRSIQRVLKFIEGELEIVAEAPEEHFPLAKACEKCRVTLSVILELLFGEHLKSVYRLKGQNGFAALLVSPSEVLKRVNDPPEDVSNEIRFWMG